MRHRNLKDPAIVDTPRRVRDMEGASPIGFSSVTRGTFRVASDEGLLVEGQAHVTGLLSGTGEIEWTGTADFTGDVTAKKFQAGVGDFNAVFDDRGLTAVGTGLYGSIGGGGSTPFTYEGGIRGGEFYMTDSLGGQSHYYAGRMSMAKDDDRVELSPTRLMVTGLPTSSSPESHRVLVVSESSGIIYKGPQYTGGAGGTIPGDTSPGDPSGVGFIWPFPSWMVSSEYGPRVAPVPGASTFHPAIDFGVGCGTPTPASAGGTVAFAGWNGGYGNAVWVTHPGGYQTRYNHLSGFAVSTGASVNQGQTIGYVGTTGISSGCHLDFQVLYQGSPISPRSVLP